MNVTTLPALSIHHSGFDSELPADRRFRVVRSEVRLRHGVTVVADPATLYDSLVSAKVFLGLLRTELGAPELPDGPAPP